MFRLYVYGIEIDGCENIGGWTLMLKSAKFKEVSETYLKLIEEYGEENVMVLSPEEELVDDGEFESNAPCDTYGMCAGSSCSHYFSCQC